jgi:small-conductance mechanosensitive channel
MELFISYWHNAGKLGQAVVTVISISLVYYVFRSIVLKRLEGAAAATDNDLDDRLVHFVKHFLSLVVFFTTIILVLRIYEIKVSPLLAGAGIAGISLGFAAKETIADILSGIFLIADRPLRVGDRVKIEHIGRHWGGWGDVIDIGLRRTRIRNTDGVSVNYPNSVLANSVITNFSFDKKPVRVRLRLQLDYSADLDQAEKVIVEAVEASGVVEPHSAQVVIRSLWDDNRGHQLSGILVEVRYCIDDVRNRTKIRSHMLKVLLAELQKNKIPLAFQLVKIDSDSISSGS